MTKRIKRAVTPMPMTRAEMEKVVGEIRELKIREMRIQAELEAERKKLDAKFAPELNSMAASIESKMLDVQLWAETNPDEFGKRKSIELTHGVIGFRTGTPKLALLSRAWTWEKVLQALKHLSFWSDCVRKKEEVDKEKIIARVTSNAGTDLDLDVVGVKVVQAESFFVEPKIEQVEVKTTKEAA